MTSYRVHIWVLGLVSLALFMRALIPLGYMPDLGSLAQGQIKMVVCTGNGLQTVLVAADFDPLQKSHHTTDTKTEHGLFCSVGVTAHWFSLPIVALLLFILVFGSSVILYSVVPNVSLRTRFALMLLPRGPPIFSV